jgi:D-alanine-D-alanine ligase
MKKIAVLLGGLSAEREVSLKSGTAVARGLKEAGFDVTEIDVGYDLPQKLAELKPDAAFISLHGTYGEDGAVQGLLEFMQIPYTHSSLQASAVCMDKESTQRICAQAGIPGMHIAKNWFGDIADVHFDIMPAPFVLKPTQEGSSVGVSIIKTPADLEKAKQNWHFGRAMVEEYIAGRELSVAVLDNPTPIALGIIELVPSKEFYDYEAKYTDGITKHIMPAPLEPVQEAEMKAIAVQVHCLLKCSGISRVDFRFDGKNPYLLEVNTHPGMTELSLVPEIANFVGIDFKNLVEIILGQAKLHLG